MNGAESTPEAPPTATPNQVELTAWQTPRDMRPVSPQDMRRMVDAGTMACRPELFKPEQRAEVSRKFWNEAFRKSHGTLEDRHPDRIWAAWRVTRMMAKVKDKTIVKRTLRNSLCSNNERTDRWMTENRPLPGSIPDDPRQMQVFQLMHGNESKPLEPLPILPPPVPEEWLEQREGYDGPLLRDGYDPDKDGRLLRWMQSWSMCSSILGISHGTPSDPNKGADALHRLLEPRLVRALYPSSAEIMAYEDMVVGDARRWAVECGRTKAGPMLADRYGLLEGEAEEIVTLALRGIAKQADDPEVARGLAIAQMDDLAHRAREGLNLSAELKARQLSAQLLGLTSSTPESRNDEAMRIIKAITNEDKLPTNQQESPGVQVTVREEG